MFCERAARDPDNSMERLRDPSHVRALLNVFQSRRGLMLIGTLFVAMAIAGAATLTWTSGFFWLFLAVEPLVAIGLYAALHLRLNRKHWAPLG